MAKRKVRSTKRAKSQFVPRQQFTLFCEGRNTEPAYFSALNRTLNGISIKTARGKGVPISVAKKAARFVQSIKPTRLNRNGNNSIGKEIQVWAVFDRDAHPNFSQAVKFCEENNVGVAHSNPCFELWLILHETDYDQPNNSQAVQNKLNKLRPEYNSQMRKIPDCNDMVTRVQFAEKRGENLISRRKKEGNPYGNPSTTVGHLTKAIRVASATQQSIYR